MAISWTSVATFELAFEDCTAPWMPVREQLGDVTHLKIEGTGIWTVGGGMFPSCGPDGIPGLAVKDDGLIITSCPVGALIGRVGGSSADVVDSTSDSLAPEKNTKPFPIGTQCTVALPDKRSFGALFIGFNTRVRPVRVTRLKVAIWGVKLPPAG